MKKRIIKLNESNLHNIVKDSVKRILAEAMMESKNSRHAPYFRDWYAEHHHDLQKLSFGFMKCNSSYPYISEEGKKMLKQGKPIYQWVMSWGFKDYCSPRNFPTIESAIEDCEKRMKSISNKVGDNVRNISAGVKVIWIGRGKNYNEEKGKILNDYRVVWEDGIWCGVH